MTREEARTQIGKALFDYDNAVITSAAFMTIVEETVNALADASYSLGLAVADEQADEDEIEFEAEFDMDDDFDDDDENNGGV